MMRLYMYTTSKEVNPPVFSLLTGLSAHKIVGSYSWLNNL